MLSIIRHCSSLSVCIVIAFTFSESVLVVAGYGDGDFEDDELLQASTDDDLSSQAVIAAFSFLCSVIISMFALIVAYFGVLEDNIIQRYLLDGVALKAKVRLSNFARPMASQLEVANCNAAPESEQEHVAEIEYKFPGPEGNEARIYKQVKILGCDLIRKPDKPPVVKIQLELEDDEDNFSLSDDRSSSQGLLEVQILVLKGYKRSGYPQLQVHRMSEFRYRIPTIFALMLTMLLATFCLYVSIITISQEDHMSNVAALGLIQLTVLAIEGLAVQACLARPLNKMVEDEYLQGNTLMTKGDASTISSGDGSYMLVL